MAKKDKQKEVDTSIEDTEATADDAEVEAPTKYELLGQVVDAQIRDDDEAGNVAFHDYAVGVMKGILSPDPADVDADTDADVSPPPPPGRRSPAAPLPVPAAVTGMDSLTPGQPTTVPGAMPRRGWLFARLPSAPPERVACFFWGHSRRSR